ncbi:fungal-specific transcription factor domain-containing protein [Dactylonectria estremocensis]|uniref:Fungal-specific transcription factor domain-containing protein n=1 Tax=Dactylonectria estremocensis TaxID=1079267 RepID=A0A9P9IUP4_9HYPO|nr:fungal-specific transcription factor domain-containing protein [Dactylonectria estremocensis]
MPYSNSQRRSNLSCDLCRTRKTKCIRSTDGRCQRCLAIGKRCLTTHTQARRPYYQTSKEQFELMTMVVNHFLPDVPMEKEALREVVATFSNTPDVAVDKSGQARQESDPTARKGDGPTEVAVRVDSPAAYMTPSSQIPPTMDPLNAEQLVVPTAYPSPELEMVCGQGDDDLNRDLMGVPRFDVGSGWTAFYSHIRSTFAGSRLTILQTQPPLSDNPRDGQPIAKVHPQNLPDRKSIDEATTRFFTEVNVGTYIMDYGEFLALLENSYHLCLPLSNASVMAIHLVFALCQNSENSFITANQYFTKAITEGTLESIQALMLLVLCLITRSQREVAWTVLGSANRIAQSLGLHTSTAWKSQSVIHEEKGNTIWWSLYSLEAFLSCVLGRDIAIQASQCTATLPLDMGLKGCPGIPPGYATFSSRLIQTYGRVTELVYQRALTKTSDFPAIYNLLEGLKKWKSDLPAYLQANCPTAPSYVRAINYLNLRYHHLVMLLTRNYLLHPLMDDRFHDGERSDLAKVCEAANDESISLIKEAFRKNVLGKTNYLDAYYILADSMILFLRALKNPSEKLTAELGEVLPLIAMTEHMHFGRFGLRSLSALYGRLNSLQDEYDNQSSLLGHVITIC